MSSGFIKITILLVLGALIMLPEASFAQNRKTRREARRAAREQSVEVPDLSRSAFRVSGGGKVREIPVDSLPIAQAADSLSATQMRQTAPQRTDSTVTTIMETGQMLPDSTYITVRETGRIAPDSTLIITHTQGSDTTMLLSGEIVNPEDQLSARERRRAQRERERLDTAYYKHNPFFRDTMRMGTNMAISMVVPGFQQFYNQDYWKIPVLYATTAAPIYLGIKQHKLYKAYKADYDYLTSVGADRSDIEPIQLEMMQHRTWQQMFFFTAAASYIYFLGEGMMNYPVREEVQTATLLSTICPGAGQIYNGSYWRAPLFLGLAASTIYIVDFNNRGYQRYKTAYALRTDGNDATKDEFDGRRSEQELLTTKNSYRRNRDLAIILTAAVYLINIMDAHVDAHLKDFDVSDDLSFKMKIEPTINTLYTMRSGTTNSFGMTLSVTF